MHGFPPGLPIDDLGQVTPSLRASVSLPVKWGEHIFFINPSDSYSWEAPGKNEREL